VTDAAGRIRVAIIDDHPVVLEGTVALLGAQPGLVMVGAAASLEGAPPLLDPAVVDVLLLDIRLGTDSGLTLLDGAQPRPAVIVLTAYDYPQYAAAARRMGAAGFVVKTAPIAELVAAIRAAAAGADFHCELDLSAAPPLTRREREVVRLVADGRSNDEIGVALGVTTKTVEGHLRRLFERLGAQSRTELATRAVREGWLEVP
jgi:DNA-binding NarL/FixJ family response regulator